MTLRTCLPVFCLFLHTAAAQDTKPKRSVEALHFVDSASALPPEFASKALLRIVRSKLISDPEWKKELIESAFLAAGQAQLPYRNHISGFPTDARLSLELASNELEALTLQTQAVEAMLPLDPARALRMYEDIPVPQIQPRTCQDPDTPDVSLYFKTAIKLFDAVFTEKQRKEEVHVRFLENRLTSVRSPAQVEPAIRMLLTTRLTESQRSYLASKLAAVLDAVSGDDRTYGITESVFVPEDLSDPSATIVLVPALRSYIRRQLSGPRCHSNIPAAGKLPRSAEAFNRLVLKIDKEGASYLPLSASEVQPSKDEGTFKPQFPWKSTRSKAMLSALQWLNHGNRPGKDSMRFWTAAERDTEEWYSHYLETLKLLEGWQETEEESPQDYIFMVSQTYSILAKLVIGQDKRDHAMESYLRFIEQRYDAAGSRNFWFTNLRMMLDATKEADKTERSWLLQHFSHSANPIIALYAQLERDF